ncbi:MAG TPA: hypothetical protein VF395_01415 [Polyangiaceae bacterium]
MSFGPLATLAALVWFFSRTALAGPPFVTDDPEPIGHRHWELYLASQTSHEPWVWSGTAPLFEANYGVVPNVQLHVIAPLAFSAVAGQDTHYGYGDMEVGSKIRFVQEGEWVPQIGTYPMLEAPTGSKKRGLGNGSAQVFVPLWIQKSFGPWTTYGGPGFWIDAGSPDRHWWYLGWEVQRKIVDGLALGAEVFDSTPKEKAEANDLRFNVGTIIDVTDTHHFLISAGRGVLGPNLFQSYFAYLMTLGPREEAE